ncbi:MAG: YegP family protein, partial [Candidatus Methanomethylophilus sp.]|nr:YegP family protein [Methanomethylophilus sp.]
MCVLTVLFRHTVLSSMAKFVVNPTKKKDGFVFSLVASNGAVIGTSQTYRS